MKINKKLLISGLGVLLAGTVITTSSIVLSSCSLSTKTSTDEFAGYYVIDNNKAKELFGENIDPIQFIDAQDQTDVGNDKVFKNIVLPKLVTTKDFRAQKLDLPDFIKWTDSNNESKMYRITEIPDNAFKEYNNISEVKLPKEIVKLGTRAFYSSKSLTKVFLSESSKLTNINGWTFYDCDNLTDVTLPNSITTISRASFYQCWKLQKINWIDLINLVTIEESAFFNCTSLQNLDLINSTKLKSIGYSSFANCSKIENIKLPSSINFVGSYAFQKNSSLRNLNFSNLTELTTAESGIFSECGLLENVDLSNSTKLKEIRFDLFRKCTSLKSVKLPNSITKINDGAFWECPQLQSVNISELNNLKSIGDNVFAECNSLFGDIRLPSLVNTIGINVFLNCNSLKNIFISQAQLQNPILITNLNDYKGSATYQVVSIN